MRSLLSRQFRKALYSTANSLTTTTTTTTTTLKPQNTPLSLPRHISTPWSHQRHTNYSIKHQEIEGETVIRDTSPLANETRDVTQSLMKTMYQLSKAVAGLGMVQLGVGAYLSARGLTNQNLLSVSASSVAFGFPFCMAIMMRQSVKAMRFFDKMENIGRLQILTSTMQISKQVQLFFVRVRVVAYASISGLVVSLLYTVFVSASSVKTLSTDEDVVG